jgi:hypothetical protein
MRDLAIELKDRPGELARVASALAQFQVTLKAGAAMSVGTRLVARLMPSDIDAARRALDAADVPFTESEAVRVVLESRAGELAALSTQLFDAGVHVRAVYITAASDNLVELAVVPDNATITRLLVERRARFRKTLGIVAT